MQIRIDYHPFPKEGEKSANPLGAVRDIMDKVYRENPKYWPYGVSVEAHDGGVYAIRKQASGETVGWVGWQERMRGPRKVGYYSVGLGPDHRGRGYAKKAVADLIAQKSATVDEVRALIHPDNKPSIALAEAVGVPVELI